MQLDANPTAEFLNNVKLQSIKEKWNYESHDTFDSNMNWVRSAVYMATAAAAGTRTPRLFTHQLQLVPTA